MSLVQELNRAHKERLARIEAAAFVAIRAPAVPKLSPKHEPELVAAPTPEPAKQKSYKLWFHIVDNTMPLVSTVQEAVCQYYNIDRLDLIASGKAQPFAYRRQIGIYLTRLLTDRSLKDIGQRFGGRDHATVNHAIRKITADRAANPELNNQIEEIIRTIEKWSAGND